MAAAQLFGVIPTGCPIIMTPSSMPAETSYVYNLPVRPFSHIVVFLLPGIVLPSQTAAAVYLASRSSALTSNLNFKFLGALGPGKESAIFKVKGASNKSISIAPSADGEVDMDAFDNSLAACESQEMILGISVESASAVAEQISSLTASRTTHEVSNALVVARPQQPDTLQLAQKIINNAFNFLASFSGNISVSGAPGTAGVEVVPLKAFEDWWKKFEGRLRSDPGFLEKVSG